MTDIQKAQEEKRRIEQMVLETLQAYQERYKVNVTDIYVNSVREMTGEENLIDVKITVEL